jgi:hypothetical protein
VAAAVAAYVSPEGPNQRNATLGRRLDAISRQFDRLERDQTVLLETMALWIRHQLAVSSPVPEGLQDAARAQGRARFADFMAQLARHLQRGGSLVTEVWQEITPEASARVQSDPAANGGSAGGHSPTSQEGGIA